MVSLRDYVAELRTSKNADAEFPDFDPLDGGINAKILFLFEKPGPRTSQHDGGSGFISAENQYGDLECSAGVGWNSNNKTRGNQIGDQRIETSHAIAGRSEDDCLGGPRVSAGKLYQSNRSINRPLLSTALTRKSGYRLLSDFISAKTTCELSHPMPDRRNPVHR
jgi:hypothetical protein